MVSRNFPARRPGPFAAACPFLLPVALLLALLVATLSPGMPRTAHAANADSVIGAVDDAMRQADRARDAYDKVRSSSDRDAMARYEREWRDSEYKLEDARIENLSRESGMSPSRIRSMRESGMGWGQVAKEAGAHPGSLGVGHSKGKKGGWNRDDDRDLYRDYYRDHQKERRGEDRDGKDRRNHDRQASDDRYDDARHGKGSHPDDDDRDGADRHGRPGKDGKGKPHKPGPDSKGKGGKGAPGKDDADYPDDGKGKGKK